MFSRSRLIGSWRPVYIMNICLHCAKRWHRNPSDMWWTSTFKIGLRKIAILMCEQKLYPIRLHVNGRNDSQHCWPTMLGVVASVCICMLLKVWPVSNFAQQLRKTCNSMQKGVQTNAICNIQQCWELLVNNVVSVCTHGAYGFRNLPSPFPGARAIRHSVHKNVHVYE